MFFHKYDIDMMKIPSQKYDIDFDRSKGLDFSELFASRLCLEKIFMNPTSRYSLQYFLLCYPFSTVG